jgi:hypothetical protein
MNARTLSHSFRTPLVSALVAFAGVGAPLVAHAADDPDASETAAARALAVDGVKLAQSDKCSEAVDKLERAEKLKHSTIVLRYLGECQVKVGRWVEGSESLRKLLREPQPEDASPTVTQAYEAAAATLRDVKPRIPNMKIVLNAPADTHFTVKVDGKEVADSVVGVALPTDPGEHQIEATAPGFLKATQTVRLAPSASAFVTLELVRDPSAPKPTSVLPAAAPATHPASASAPPPAAAPAAKDGSSTGRILAFVSYGVAAVGLGVGIGFGQSAMHDEKTLSADCPNKVCTPEHQDALDAARTKGTISTIGFAAAGAGLTLGTVLLFTSSGSHDKKASNAPAHTASSGVRAQAKLGLGSISVSGDF